ncbi:hypothetical protein GCM10009555_052470 [Acrocarpospora macrocephala]|uniref:DUF4240 domain-containing protein n=1 Tax=Acrocarpospora macrocephala TaxID=150177 RepID=A0A5M3XDK8_9ACTN|nr:DUF4240 domain-containing protein [Acrocarpospora macrocephala]GES16973.1 hypothetical protein Amac_105710 [Acrocarpospora macrocephala]
MDIEGFWDLIERSSREAASRKERLAWLEGELCRRSVEEIVDYQACWDVTANRGCRFDLYAAYWFVFGSTSFDWFEYFVNWLISLGRATFEPVADCPDRLIEQPQVLAARKGEFAYCRLSRREQKKSTWMEEGRHDFASLAHVAYDAYAKVTGEDEDNLYEAVRARGIRSEFPVGGVDGSDLRGEHWDLDDDQELARRLPRIARYRNSGEL